MSDWRTILRGFCKPWSDGGNGGSTLGLAIREAMAEVERLEAAFAKREAEVKSLKIQNAYLLGEHEKIRQFFFDLAARSESLCTCAELRAKAWAVETKGENDASQRQ